MSNANDNFYAVLEVTKDASQDEIRRAYRRLALQYHPDKNPGNRIQTEEKFKQICTAYKALTDPKAHRVHDKTMFIPNPNMQNMDLGPIIYPFFGSMRNNPFNQFCGVHNELDHAF